MEKILVSACLLGMSCRYDGKDKKSEKVLDFIKDYEIIPICPEIMGGLSTPRVPAEIVGSQVINKIGQDVSKEYDKGASETLKLVKLLDIKKVLLKSNSPSCGHGKVYDGTFTGKLVNGNGITCQLLIDNNIEVITENDI